MQIDKVVWHLTQVQPQADRLVKFMTIMDNQRLILLIHIAEEFVVRCQYLISLPLKAEIGQVLAAVDPVPNGTLYAVDDWDQDLLDHL